MEDWEKRFDAVVRETERNLAKVKGTLQITPAKYKLSSQAATTPRHILLDQQNRYTSHVIPTRDHHVTFQENSKPDPGSYHKEFWRQEDEIQKLRKQISLLQQSNVHYEQDTKLLKTQVQSLKNKGISRAISPGSRTNTDVTREFEKFKSEVLTEVERLKQGITLGNGGVSSDKEFTNIRKDIDRSRLRHAEDFQELKSDLDSLRARLVKVELEVTSAMSDGKECIRRCQRLGSEASHFNDTIRIQSKSTSSQLQSLNDNCAHLSVLRGTVSDIEGRLSSLEGTGSRTSNYRNDSVTPASLRDSSGTRGSSYIGDLGKHSKPAKLKCGLLDELDISYSLDDLSILSDDVIDEEDDDDILDESLDESSETFKNSSKLSLTESVSMVGETLSVVGETLSVVDDLVSGMSGILSDDDDI